MVNKMTETVRDYVSRREVGIPYMLQHEKPVELGTSGPGIYWDRSLRKAEAGVYAEMAIGAIISMIENFGAIKTEFGVAEGIPAIRLKERAKRRITFTMGVERYGPVVHGLGSERLWRWL